MQNTISVSEARKRLPQLLREIQKDAGKVVKITVRNEVVAEIRPPSMIPEPGLAARKLLAFRRRHTGASEIRPVEAVSENTKQ